MATELPESVDRETLYELVWTIPMKKLAGRFGVSDVALRKVCKRLQVPVPSVGYWAKVYAGHAQDRKPLSKARSESPGTHYFDRRAAEGLRAAGGKASVGPVEQITVSELLTRPHPLVTNTREALKRLKPDTDGILVCRGTGSLDLRVSPAQLNRALRILDAVVNPSLTTEDQMAS